MTIKTQTIKWEEPNRRNTPPLHIASRGDRFSTLTGVWWIDEFRYVVNHRSGLRIALFDLRAGDKPIAMAPIPHLTDDIAVKPLSDNQWEIAVSGCWDCTYSIFKLTLGETPQLQIDSTKYHLDRSFCHGVAYDSIGQLWLAIHTGENPRIEVSESSWKLPEPWGARDICIDESSNQAYAVAVSNNPQLSSYKHAATSIWKLDSRSQTWNQIGMIKSMHADACQIYKDRIWIPDQLNDRVLGVDIHQNDFDFPHGLGISPKGMLAVTNYGASSITLVDLRDISL